MVVISLKCPDCGGKALLFGTNAYCQDCGLIFSTQISEEPIF
ncbi:MAG: hypothetical protein N3D75_04490 [Candidatus Aenigmarchaeota archaeon]|nr:hypothetical protein [Candidatus Aenigmarchaeota archaeon]